MTKIGMIGGLGPTATLYYYKTILEDYKYAMGMPGSPEIIIYSMDNHTLQDLIKRERWSILVSWLIRGIKTLHFSGAGFAFIAGTTPHIVFDELQRISPIPLISIVEEACYNAASLNLKRVGLLGTAFTMQSSIYKNVFDKKEIEIVIPTLLEQQYIHKKMSTEIQLGVFSEEIKTRFIEIINRMKYLENIEGIVLGCTKLPAFLPHLNLDIPVINTPLVHINSIIKQYIKINNR